MKVVFFGLGSIGARHARLVRDNFDHEIYAYRHSGNAKKNSLGVPELFDLNDVVALKPDVAFITNPTHKHVEYAVFCAKHGIDLFIEKPLASGYDGLNELCQEVKRNNVKAYVAYNLRFHPAIAWLKNHLKTNVPLHLTVNCSSFLPSWRPEQNHLEGYSAFKSKGWGVLFDLSHEVDYLCYLLGDVKSVKGNAGRLSDVTIDSEDFADVLLEFKNNTFCNLHLNFMSRLLKRKILLDFKDYSISVDLINNKLAVIKDKETTDIKFDVERDDTYLSQLNYFFKHLKDGGFMNDIDEAKNVFDVIMKIKDAVRE